MKITSVEITNFLLNIHSQLLTQPCRTLDSLQNFKIDFPPQYFSDFFKIACFLIQKANLLTRDAIIIDKLYTIGNLIMFSVIAHDKIRTNKLLEDNQELSELELNNLQGVIGFIKIQASVRKIRKQAILDGKKDFKSGAILNQFAYDLERIESVGEINTIKNCAEKLFKFNNKQLSFVKRIFIGIINFFSFRKNPRKRLTKWFKCLQTQKMNYPEIPDSSKRRREKTTNYYLTTSRQASKL